MNIALFPGTDAIENAKLRSQAWKNQTVQAKVIEANQVIKESIGFDIDLSSHMTAANDPSLQGFQKLVLCSLATQVALFENYQEEFGDIDGLMGLSLGDTARSVAAGLCTFEEAVLTLYKFTTLSHHAESGASIHIRLDRPLVEMRTELLLEDYGLEISVMQNDSFFLAAGSSEDIKSWISDIAKPQSINFKLLYPFPLHSSLMTPICDAMRRDIESLCGEGNHRYEIFSTVLAKKLEGKKELIEDSILNINSSLLFTKTIRHIRERYDQIRFINIGPAPTLLQFISRMGLATQGLQMEDWFGRQNLQLQFQTA